MFNEVLVDSHFSLFWPRENWGGRKKVLPSVLRSPPIFAQPKSEKRLQREESPTEMLVAQATMSPTLSYA